MPACPALFVAAAASGQGKTSVTAALARHHRRLGRRVRVFKTGPDFLDPMLLARASGASVYSLDLGMVGERGCRALLARAAAEADVILIEGVMGLFDGTPSSADLAQAFRVPVAAVISAQSMAQTFAALAFGLAHFRPGVPFHGVLANRVGSERHAQLLRGALPASIRWLGHLPRDAQIALPERHLGLHQPDDIADLDARIDRAADAIARTALAELPPVVEFAFVDANGHGMVATPGPTDDCHDAPATASDAEDDDGVVAATNAVDGDHETIATSDAAGDRNRASVASVASAAATQTPSLAGKRIAIARDAAFSFIYPANLDQLEALGAELAFFSPLADAPLPAGCDALYLPGGYPELHAARLAANATTARAIAAHVAAGKPVVAECGGMLYLSDSLTDVDGARTPMLGLVPGDATMQRRFAALGMQTLATRFGAMTGHTFHYSRFATPLAPVAAATRPDDGAAGEAVYRHGSIVATYFHAYWPSNPPAAAALFTGDAP
ncbi:cobyrinate a,c-diamide synthase [Burkholderia oklahomensis]|uniref:cobyrinate a,c-diamide synthase n=1 Tax=Burkholderia oklahomensis TaxID=342113 RepID=UPI00016A8D47|nr:cobyrinate a,c-diamide synthase [Burkholderia oklahomensis]AJX30815.1 cobB/CobQ-like glutamine amidotransferase domain protein [Burkholderia oklahomensis C6786]AOI46019.1 cobyrinic acid a,c-diamide synthase [Burkholderia oklahomensis C6786]KUY54748.1 cobyrinic acid a,c-diamide synthase [Burkholderia oklahomensis C6786]MBI0361427.1 cobyrinate a,c-diamide synthase [Burkholderia oklahomensis]SUW55387.1 Cobyrinic acid A,C-diamide synthase [Burkholderia oklahomensis]